MKAQPRRNPPRRGFVIVKTLDGKKAEIQFEQLTLAQFRQKAAELLEIPVERLRLIWIGVELLEGRKWLGEQIKSPEIQLMRDLNPGCREGHPPIFAIEKVVEKVTEQKPQTSNEGVSKEV